MNDVVHIPRIQTLPTTLANQIAAGEVVERPASVIKELLENAIDAGATRISIDLENAGVSLIRINDNGHGIHVDDLPLALASHSTSKIQQTSDLEAIYSLGFRGEALASIASVAHLCLKSAHDTSKQGMMLVQSPEQKTELSPVAQNRGTTVEVRDLFFNTPARRKFLRTENTEYLHCLSLVKATALCQFGCAFQMKHNGRSVLSLAASNQDYSRRVADICGRSFVENSFAFDFSHEQLRLWGWLGKAEIARSQSDRQYLFLNGRLIKDKHINHAIRMAFQDRLYQGRFPCYVLFLEMEPSLVDVNVHPTKQEVRFRRNRDVHDFVYSCLQQVLSPEYSVIDPPEHSKRISDVGNSESQYSVVEEPGEHYQKTVPEINEKALKSHYSIANSALKLNQSYGVIEVEKELLLFDRNKMRSEMIRARLKEQLKNGRVISKPLLMPMELQLDEKSLDKIEDHEGDLSKLGIHIKRITPNKLLIRELPQGCAHIDVNALMTDIIELSKKNDSTSLIEEDLIELLSNHANDHVPDVNNEQENAELLDYCLQAFYKSSSRSKKALWRLFSEQDLKKLLS